MRISDWSSVVCSSDLAVPEDDGAGKPDRRPAQQADARLRLHPDRPVRLEGVSQGGSRGGRTGTLLAGAYPADRCRRRAGRSEEHTSELQSLMRISYAVFCLKKKKNNDHSKLLKARPHET